MEKKKSKQVKPMQQSTYTVITAHYIQIRKNNLITLETIAPYSAVSLLVLGRKMMA